MTKGIFLQCKFLLVALLNLSYNLMPYPLRNIYLFFWGIRVPVNSSVHHGCKFFHIGNCKIGKNSVVNFGCYLDNRRGIVIGNNVAIAHDTKIYTLGHNIESRRLESKGAPVSIEDNVFVFSNVLIMPGVTIHEGAIILPGSIVTKDVPAWGIVGGTPAKVIRYRNTEIAYKNNYNYWFAL